MNASHTELRYIGPAFLNSATINPKLKKQTIEFFTGACSRCREVRMFAGYDCGRPASTVCFYCVVTEEYEREKRSGWHPDIAEAIAQAQAYEGTAAEFYAPRPLAAKAESEIADLRIRCERAEAEIEGLTGDTHALDAELAARAEKAEAELATVKAELEAKRPEAKAPTRDALQRAILETLQTLALAWPGAEIPSSRLWAAVVDCGAVATVRPGQAAEGEAHRFYKAKMALIRDGLITELRAFVRLASAPSSSSAELEPTFQD